MKVELKLYEELPFDISEKEGSDYLSNLEFIEVGEGRLFIDGKKGYYFPLENPEKIVYTIYFP